MHQLNPNRLLIGRPVSMKVEAADLGTYLFQLGQRLALNYPEVTVRQFIVQEKTRIPMMRNMMVADAKREGCGKIYMIDPDARPDFYVRQEKTGGYLNRFRPFFDAAWQFMREHRGDVGPCVLAAPARGAAPDHPVQVFRRDRGNYIKITADEAVNLTGWHRVGAVGTHMMLIDTEVFYRLEHPYFEDLHTDNTHTELLRGQDVNFCHKCNQIDVPVLVNFDCWSDHWQMECVRMPGAEKERIFEIPEQFRGKPVTAATPQSAEPNYRIWE